MLTQKPIKPASGTRRICQPRSRASTSTLCGTPTRLASIKFMCKYCHLYWDDAQDFISWKTTAVCSFCQRPPVLRIYAATIKLGTAIVAVALPLIDYPQSPRTPSGRPALASRTHDTATAPRPFHATQVSELKRHQLCRDYHPL